MVPFFGKGNLDCVERRFVRDTKIGNSYHEIYYLGLFLIKSIPLEKANSFDPFLKEWNRKNFTIRSLEVDVNVGGMIPDTIDMDKWYFLKIGRLKCRGWLASKTRKG